MTKLREVRTLDYMYGEGDLATGEVFTGGFCNFGYWEHLPESAAPAPRTAASAQLYRHLLGVLTAGGGVELAVEVGAGRGHGAAIALEEFDIARVIAIDQSAPQIARLREFQEKWFGNGRLEGRQGEAGCLPVEDATVDVLYSVEALQHFPSKPAFLREAARVLRPGGRFALTTFFLKQAEDFDAVRALIPTVAAGITLPCAIGALVEEMVRAGFGEIKVEPIGEQVFRGFDRWLEIIGERAAEKDSWGRNWLKCYQAGWIDYYVIEAIIT